MERVAVVSKGVVLASMLTVCLRYIEWEDYPEKKLLAHEIMISQKFPPPPEYQLAPVPSSNPVLEGVRWKLWHKALGGPLSTGVWSLFPLEL